MKFHIAFSCMLIQPILTMDSTQSLPFSFQELPTEVQMQVLGNLDLETLTQFRLADKTSNQQTLQHATQTKTNASIRWALLSSRKNIFTAVNSRAIPSLAISADDSFIVFGSRGNVATILKSNGELLHELQVDNNAVSVAISSNSELIAIGSSDSNPSKNIIELWDPFKGVRLCKLIGHIDGIHAIAISSDNKFIITGSGDKSAKIWDTNSAQCLFTLEGHSEGIRALIISSDNKFIATGSWDGTARIWKTETGEILHILKGHTARINSMAMSSDNKQLITVSCDKTIKIWDAQTGLCLHTLEGHTDRIMSVQISSNDTLLVTAGMDKTARIWNLKTHDCLHVLQGHNSDVSCITISKDTSLIVTGSWDNTVKIWDTYSGKCQGTFSGNTESFGWIQALSISKNGNFITSGAHDNTIKIWSIENINLGKKPEELPVTEPNNLTVEEIEDVLVTPIANFVDEIKDKARLERVKNSLLKLTNNPNFGDLKNTFNNKIEALIRRKNYKFNDLLIA